MPLSRLENFLINTDGNILYVNPSDLDATDSFDNKGNSLTRPFKTIQRALIEAARFSYQVGSDNDRFDRTTILLYPGTHLIDNRRGLFVRKKPDDAGVVQFFDQNENNVTSTTSLTLNSGTQLDIENGANVLYKFNSVDGGLIVPKGTSIVGLDLRKTKIRPLYVPDPEDQTIDRSALFRVTGGCYFWQFSMFDADREVFFNNNYGIKKNPAFSHHKLTCFEYADGITKRIVDGEPTNFTDLQMYYFKLMNAYGADTGNRQITNFPTSEDFQPNTPEFKIVGDLTANDFSITELKSQGKEATVTTELPHGLREDDSFRIIGVGASALYEGSFKVGTAVTARQFNYTLPADPNQDNIAPSALTNAKVVIEADNVTGASPYIFNISLRSVFGMCGLHADGSKATGFKSIVVAQFTGIGLQKDPNAFLIYDDVNAEFKTNTTASSGVTKPLYINQDAVYSPNYESFHVKASNDSVIQAVSVFAIGFANHFLAESGADQSITNSNSNFGAKSLIAKGFRKQSFNRDDTGYITHVVPPKDLEEDTVNVSFKVLDPVKTKSVGVSSHLFIADATDEGNPPSNISSGYKIGANNNETLYLDLVLDPNTGITTTFTAPILMQVPVGDGPQGKKVFEVQRTAGVNVIDVPNDVITLTANHNFITGESIRINSDDGRLPDGIKPDTKFYVITIAGSGNESKIKIASTLNNALNGSAVDIKNTKGGFITIESRVTDKLPGEVGHPIQYDSTNSNWFITSSSLLNTNKIYEVFDGTTGGIANSTIIAANNAIPYVQRVPENRDLTDRVYKLRYVIPRDFKNAKAPTKNFILQESKTTNEETTIDSAIKNRNPRIIADVTRSGATITIRSEKDHKISVGDRVHLKNIVSVGNTLGADELSYNGYFDVTTVPTNLTFTVQNTLVGAGDTFTDQMHTIKTSGDITKLPAFERNEYKTTYIIQDVETIQEYDSGVEDGVYYLTVLRSDISPPQDPGTNNPFSSRQYKQDYQTLYPVVDRDNAVVDPLQSTTAASNALLGKVSLDDTRHSITKETVIEYLKDVGVGIAVTGAEKVSGGLNNEVDYFFERNHGLATLKGDANNQLQIAHHGTGYAGFSVGSPGAGSTVLYNVQLVNGQGGMPGADATANIGVAATGAITSVTIVNGGSGYQTGVGQTLIVSGGDANNQTSVFIGNLTDEGDNVIQFVGVGSIGNRKNSGFNGVYRWNVANITANSIRILNGPANPGVHTVSNGIAIIGSKQPSLATNSNNGFVGVAGTTLPGIVTVNTFDEHALSPGNRVRIQFITGPTVQQVKDVFEGDFIVRGVPTNSSFTIEANPGITATGVYSALISPYALGATGQDTSLQSERVSGSLLKFTKHGIFGEINGTYSSTATEIIIFNAGFNQNAVDPGDYFQIEDEIVRVTSIGTPGGSGIPLTVIRGVMGTIATSHGDNTLIQKIQLIPAEVRRFSSIRASGHTFEYVGYGPGNYSTALPQRIQRTLTREEEMLSIYCEKKGGVTFFSGMNDRGEFFTLDGRQKPVERFISEIGNDFTGVFDDLYVRNTLRVGGGPNRNFPSEFRGPVNFTNKITNTDTIDGIGAVKLQLQGTNTANPFFQVGSDVKPSLIVNQSSQKVGIQTADPKFDLDVNGTIRANIYENFKLSDLPNTPTEEVTFAKNRILKVNEAATGYELVDINVLPLFRLTSYGVNNDGRVHVGTGSTVGGKLQIAGVSTNTFAVGQKVKMFGVGISTSPVTVANMGAAPQATKIGTATNSKLYRYWVGQFNLRTGDIGALNGPVSANQTELKDFNDLEHIALTLQRTSTENGLVVYRQTSAMSGVAADITAAKLIAIIGPRELAGANASFIYKDFGNYDQTAWNKNNDDNEFDEDQIHFPNTGFTGKRRGWNMDEIVSIGTSSITVSRAYDFNDAVGFGTTKSLKVVADNTLAFKTAIDDITAKGGTYLELPSGVFLTNKITLPTNFTVAGVGKNSIIKQQFFANDTTDDGGNSLDNNNILIGIGITNAQDITLSDFTIDGNSTNQYHFADDNINHTDVMVEMTGVSDALFKNIELRNSPMNGMSVVEGRRISIENSTFVDGSITDRYQFKPLKASETTSLRINDSLFENYPAGVDVSSSSVVAVGGNIIRNCGRGLIAFATGKITTTDNIILGPADEFIPSPDIFDSDFNGINITVDTNATFEGPVLQYIEEGEPKDISSNRVTITAGIGTMVGQGSTVTGESLSDKFLNFSFITPNTGEKGRENGYIQTKLTSTQTATLASYVGAATTSLGYSIVGVEFQDVPVGLTTFIGISSGIWHKNGSPFIGVGATEYRVTLKNASDSVGILTGDIVKLEDHSVTPSLSAKVLTVQQKNKVGADQIIHLVGITTTSVINGGPNLDDTQNGYISIRKQFVIAKGRVGVI